MNPIVERLREWADKIELVWVDNKDAQLCRQAAALIETMGKDTEQLRSFAAAMF